MKMPRLDKSVVTIGTFDDSAERRAYWHSRTPAQRLAAMEQLRRINYGEHASTELAPLTAPQQRGGMNP